MWLATVDSTAFWHERSRTGTLEKSRAAYSAFVDNMIMEETPKAQTSNDKVDQVGNVEEDEENEDDASEASNKKTQTPNLQ